MKLVKAVSLITVLSILTLAVAICVSGDVVTQSFAQGTIKDDAYVTETFSYDFVSADLERLKNDSMISFQLGENVQKSTYGLYVANSGWDSVGINYHTKTNGYTFSTFLRHGDIDSSAGNQAVMVGVRCNGTLHLYIDTGIWALCYDDGITFYCDGVNTNIKFDSLPASFKNGATLTVKDKGGNGDIEYYISSSSLEKTYIGRLTITGASINAYDESGAYVASYKHRESIRDGGYCRIMSHYVEGYISNMTLEVQQASSFYENKPIIAVAKNKKYCFADLVKYDLNKQQNAPCFEYTGGYYISASVLAQMVGMEYSEDAKGLKFTYGSNVIEYFFGKDKVNLLGNEVDANMPIMYKDTYFICADEFASFIGYKTVKDASGIMIMHSPQSDASSSLQLYKERFALYDQVVFNYSDVSCDQTGVGKYKQCPQDERLVGVAYTTWLRPNSSWGDGYTWDMPLIGPYASDNRNAIRQHAIWLADAGVDFIVVDWSNNVGYDPKTMYREDFAMIENATYAIFEVFATVENAPKICIMTGPGHVGTGTFTDGQMARKNNQIYNEFIANSAYNDMYFYYEGKPLLLCYAATPSFIKNNTAPYTDSRFTERWVTGFIGQQSGLYNTKTYLSYLHWSWEERIKQTYTVYNNIPECMTVVAAYRGQGTAGQSGYIAPGGRNNGQTFLTQWQRANDIGVKISLVVSFNEWTTGEQNSLEVSKDIEPCVTYGTLYLDILKEQIKKFKGKVDTSVDSVNYTTGVYDFGATTHRNGAVKCLVTAGENENAHISGWFASSRSVSGFQCSVNGGSLFDITSEKDSSIPERVLAYMPGCNGINTYKLDLASEDLNEGKNNVKVYAKTTSGSILCADLTLISSDEVWISSTDGDVTVQRGDNVTYVRVPCGYTSDMLLSVLNKGCVIDGELATGSRIDLTVDSLLCDTAYIIVSYDINGDGTVNAKDCIRAKKLREDDSSKDIYFDACDLDLDGEISLEEIVTVSEAVIN